MGLSSANQNLGTGNCDAGGVSFLDGFPDSGFCVAELADQVVYVPMPQIVKEIVQSCEFAGSALGIAVTGRLCPTSRIPYWSFLTWCTLGIYVGGCCLRLASRRSYLLVFPLPTCSACRRPRGRIRITE